MIVPGAHGSTKPNGYGWIKTAIHYAGHELPPRGTLTYQPPVTLTIHYYGKPGDHQ